MAKNRFDSFERVFATRALFRGKARSSLIWSGVSSLLLCVLLFDLCLIVDLLSSQGRLNLTADENVILEERLGIASDDSLSSLDAAASPADSEYENSGLINTLWWSRTRYWGGFVAAGYRRFGMLQENSTALILLIGAAVGIGFIRSLLLSRAQHLNEQITLDIVTSLRRILHRQTLRLGPSDLEDTESRHVLSLFIDEMDHVRDGLLAWISRLGRYPLEVMLLLFLALSIHWRVCLQTLIPLAACWYLIQRQRERIEASRKLADARSESELRLLAESFNKTRLVRGHGMESFEQQQFQRHLDRFKKNVSTLDRSQRWSRWNSRILVTVIVSVILGLIGIKVLLNPDDLPLGAAALLVVTFGMMYRPLQGLWDLPLHRRNVSRAADRIFRYLNQIPEVGQAVGAKFLNPLSKSIQFEGVSYSLPDKRKLLDGFDLKISAGEVIAAISIDPLEARALAYLLPRFIEPQVGRVLFDGDDIAWVTLESLRAETIYVGGTDPFFTGTVRENISCGSDEFSLPEIIDAAKETHAHHFIQKLSQGYETVLGEHGEQLDSGQSFRLSLARAVTRKPALLIIAEPTDLLDYDTKSLLDDAYHRITANRSVLFLPSRLSTLRRADRIVLIHNGKVEAFDHYSQLVKKSPLYRHWEYMQFNEFRSDREKPV